MEVSEMKQYVVILEKGDKNWGAYSPDVPGVIATGDTEEETLELFREALAFHLEGLELEGYPIPQPVSQAHLVGV